VTEIKHAKITQRSPRNYWVGQGRRLVMIPSLAIARLLKKNRSMNTVYLTDMGYYPEAAGHDVSRVKGSPEYILFYCIGGKGWCRFGNRTYNVEKDHFFLLPAKQAHAYGSELNDPWSIYWFMFKITDNDDEVLKNIQQFIKPTAVMNPMSTQVSVDKIEGLLLDGHKSHILTQANLHFSLLLMSLLHARRSLQEGNEMSPVERSIQYMKKHLQDKITVQEIADEIEYSPSRYYTLFKAETGQSPMEFFSQIKMNYACQLLINTDKQVREIAHELGFEDPYHFSRLFKITIGKSPLHYRSAMRV
jgi:AraC family transcriptional regulator, arabinose operon regulatory protein